ncbi:hypothetical protein MKW98_013372 [Papaver atlanticum]|uniref:MIP18 family-like domain-containing protein n=1 Tax=Papaver atlanticum TaxID=357466 RepID=A0AAD4XIS7_9MAGN|nr:hypothetical protein MKW98_013372 [Papaver atlanticum]
MVRELSNKNHVVYERKKRRIHHLVVPADVDEYAIDPIDQQEVFDILKNLGSFNWIWAPFFFLIFVAVIFISLTVLHHIRDIKDPEYPYTLEELQVVTEDSVEINDKRSHVRVTFTPTVGNCSLAPAIGLCLQVKLMRSLPSRYKVDIRVAPGTLHNEAAVNKQLNDKERTAAASENPIMGQLVEECLAPTYE